MTLYHLSEYDHTVQDTNRSHSKGIEKILNSYFYFIINYVCHSKHSENYFYHVDILVVQIFVLVSENAK